MYHYFPNSGRSFDPWSFGPVHIHTNDIDAVSSDHEFSVVKGDMKRASCMDILAYDLLSLNMQAHNVW